jgi:hypothetical protein
VTGVVGVFTLPTRVTQPSFFPDVVARDRTYRSVQLFGSIHFDRF